MIMPNLIPTVATDAQMSIYIDNIIAVYRSATDDQLTEGRAWYRSAHHAAKIMSGGDVVRGAGVIAALSPHAAWEYNVKIAGKAFDLGEPSGHTRDAVGKAARIMAGEDPMIVLPAESKTWSFFRCIVDPDDADPVVIDRHAHDLAVGARYGNRDRGLSNRRRYATLARAYREAARRLGEIPSVVQAITWVVWREAGN
jgi:hypothetical protein